MDFINRPPDEEVGSVGSGKTMLDVVKREIKTSVLYANRRYGFKYTEKVFTINYPNNAKYIYIDEVCQHKVLGIISIDLVKADGDLFGTPIPVTSFSELQERREAHDDKHTLTVDSENTESFEASADSFETFITSNYRYLAFLLGTGLGLYPTPTKDTFLRIHHHALLPELVEDDDTNFFLEYGWDFILYKTLHSMETYLKQDVRFPVTQAQTMEAWQSFVEWDMNVRYDRPIKWQ